MTSTIGLWSFGLTLMECEFGDRVTNRFCIFANELQQCEWYLFSIKTQQMLAITILNAQQSIMFRGSANTKFTRKSFTKVINSSKWY